MPGFILTNTTGPIARITLNRPDRRNSLTVEMLEELCSALDSAAKDASIRAVILQGAGNSFSSGFDLAESLDLKAALKQAELLVMAQLLLAEMDPVCIAVAHGYALAGGGALIAACDYAVATEDAKFGYPVLKVGIVPTPGMPFLRHELKDRDFRELVLGGEIWDGARAHRAGLVNKVFATLDEAVAEAERFAGIVAAGSPTASAATKRFANQTCRKSLRTEMAEAIESFITVRSTEEAQEGLQAFAEKRQPSWSRPA